MNRIICKLFGHKLVETSFKEWRGKGRYRKQWKVKSVHCARCGAVQK